jgi:hypothetical protein
LASAHEAIGKILPIALKNRPFFAIDRSKMPLALKT